MFYTCSDKIYNTTALTYTILLCSVVITQTINFYYSKYTGIFLHFYHKLNPVTQRNILILDWTLAKTVEIQLETTNLIGQIAEGL